MKTVKVRKTVIGEGRPKICVPILGKNKEELLSEVDELKQLDVDVVEWRMDWFDDIMDHSKACAMLHTLREALGDMVILATFRTKQEGGEKAIQKKDYVALYHDIIMSKDADLIDVELFIGEEEVKTIVKDAHNHQVAIVMSNHDFVKTPSCDEIVARLKTMQERDADISKMAVMPQSKADVITLLSATNIMYEQFANRPIITMSMAKDGIVSRICGEVFGSAMTFGAATKASAPGQVAAKDLKNMVEMLHKSLKEE